MENTKRQNLLEELRIAEFTSADVASDALKRVEKADNSEATTLNISEEAARRADLDGAA